MHVRRAIRDAVAVTLAGIPATSGRVFKARRRPFEDYETPAIVVETPADTVTTGGAGPVRPRLQSRDQVVVITVVGADQDEDGAIDALDGIAEAVEAALAANPSLGLGAKDVQLRGSSLDAVAVGKQTHAACRLQYSVVVSTREGSPSSVHAPA
jgi:hypothetical protein